MTINNLGKEFIRPLLQVSRTPVTDPSAIHSLPDLIDFDAEHNPNHEFALQEIRQGGKHLSLTPVTFSELKNAAITCAHLIRKRLPSEADGEYQYGARPPVAIFLESDVNLFVHLAALLYLNIPALVLSIRLSPAAVSHLLNSTSACAIIVSPKTKGTAENSFEGLSPEKRKGLQIVQCSPFQELLQLASVVAPNGLERHIPSDKETAIILHSSGTTGLPKPIPLAHRYLLGYAACHRLQPNQCLDKRNVSTLPMYHGFGLLGPCISLATGKPCCLLSASTIPSAASVSELIKISASSSLMTVPSILEDARNSSSLMQALVGLDFVAVGGGPIKPAVGELLVTNGVKLLNHYGATEIGAIAPIFVPGNDYDWHYLRIRTDIGLEINEVSQKDDSGVPFYQLVGYPFGWDRPFAIQDLLRRRPESSHIEVAILGRNDDLLVLSTGEKVLPNQFEATLSRQDGVKTAVVFGQNREEVGVLIEPEVPLEKDELDAFVLRIWKVVQQENLSLDRHARVSSKSMILLKPLDKAIPRSDKGSVMRGETYEIFAKEIEELYTVSDADDSLSFTLETHPDRVISSLRSMVESCVQDRGIPVADWADSDDWFEQGMDSLEATRLARMLSRLSNKDLFPALASSKIQPSFIYQHPSFKALAECLLVGNNNIGLNDSSTQMLDLVSKYTPAPSQDWVVLLTGATGHLGVHLLGQLSRNTNVSQVICVGRVHQGQDPKHRQQEINRARGVALPEFAWTKIRFLSTNQLSQPQLGLQHDEYCRLVRTVTHIVHAAWPMDFQRSLTSFEPQIQTLRNLIDLSRECHREQGRSYQPRLLFTSSIAVAARFTGRRKLPESKISDPSVPAEMGYARAKWVCEQILNEVARTHGDLLRPSVVRLGQLTGDTHSGIWNSNEHFPTILKASQLVGALPELDGTFSWIPIDVAAKSIVEILFSLTNGPVKDIVYHVENPIRQAWKPLLPVLAAKLGLKTPLPIPFSIWFERVSSLSSTKAIIGSIHHLLPFLQEEFHVLSSGGIILDTTRARVASRSLRACEGVTIELLDRYLASWRKERFLQ
ncbi:hypothetical protein BDV59DRAFT_99330 [Aspergillus ambiguus]|uniref:uncharacterized protein n=1 Tax=Aspergillus ambiguus TaxID=176160 RepID=UPI003CCD4DD0